MSKMVLNIDEDYQFDLLGISCHSKDYRLCWELNQTVKTDLTRTNDLIIEKKEITSNYSLYEYFDNANHLRYFLIANRGSNGFLIPEKKNTDFMLIIKGIINPNYISKIIAKINSISLILTCFTIDPHQLKSKQNLIF